MLKDICPTYKRVLAVMLSGVLIFSGIPVNGIRNISVTQAAEKDGGTSENNALKALGFNTDITPEGFDKDDTESNPYGKKTILGDVSDEVFVGQMGLSGSAIIGNNVSGVTGKTYTYHYAYEFSEGKNVISFRNNQAIDGVGDAYYGSFISDIAVSGDNNEANAKKALTDNGYTVIERDLNEGASGQYVYLGYKTSSDPTRALTNIIIGIDFDGQPPKYLSYLFVTW